MNVSYMFTILTNHGVSNSKIAEAYLLLDTRVHSLIGGHICVCTIGLGPLGVSNIGSALIQDFKVGKFIMLCTAVGA